MTERIPRSVLIAAAVLAVPALVYAAYSRPWYFTSQTYLAGLIFLELLLAAIWMYRRVFFPVVLITFLLAGVNLPVGRGWIAARWVVLGAGALVGLLLVLKDRMQNFGLFQRLAAWMRGSGWRQCCFLCGRRTSNGKPQFPGSCHGHSRSADSVVGRSSGRQTSSAPAQAGLICDLHLFRLFQPCPGRDRGSTSVFRGVVCSDTQV